MPSFCFHPKLTNENVRRIDVIKFYWPNFFFYIFIIWIYIYITSDGYCWYRYFCVHSVSIHHIRESQRIHEHVCGWMFLKFFILMCVILWILNIRFHICGRKTEKIIERRILRCDSAIFFFCSYFAAFHGFLRLEYIGRGNINYLAFGIQIQFMQNLIFILHYSLFMHNNEKWNYTEHFGWPKPPTMEPIKGGLATCTSEHNLSSYLSKLIVAIEKYNSSIARRCHFGRGATGSLETTRQVLFELPSTQKKHWCHSRYS